MRVVLLVLSLLGAGSMPKNNGRVGGFWLEGSPKLNNAHATVGLNDPSVPRLITKFRGCAVTNCRLWSKCVTEVDVNGNGASPLEVR